MHVHVLEASGRIGGIARTETYRGYLFDIGGHRFFTKNRQIERLWYEMLGDDFLEVQRISRIYYQDRFLNYPLAPVNVLASLGILESLLVILSYIKAQARPSLVEETFEQWVCNRFGQRLYLAFFKSYTEKVWGVPCREIRADWAAQRIRGLTLVAALYNALFGIQKAKSLITTFRYPRLGPGMMWQRFKETIEAGGGRVSMESEVISLEHDQRRITSVVCRQDGRTERLPAENVISSMPLPKVVRLLSPAPPAAVLDAARALKYRDFLIVGLIVAREDLFPDQWIYIHSSDVRVGRIQNMKNWSAAMVPDPATSSIGMEYFCNSGDDLWMTSDVELGSLAGRELARLGLADQADILDSFVVRQPGAYPVYDQDYQTRVNTIRSYLQGFANLQTIGRNGMHRYNNMDHSMQTGILAVENLAGAGHDLWTINEEEEYLEEQQEKKVSVTEKILIRSFARMDKLAMATSVGSVCGLLVLAATLWIISRGGDVQGSHLRLLAQYFIGYTVTVKGGFIAFGYTFFWGFLGGWLFAYLRNFLLAAYVFSVRKKTELLTLRDFFDQL